MQPLSIRLRLEKERRLDFISKQENKRCRVDNCINWAAGEITVGVVAMHNDLIVEELGLCWKHVKEQRARRIEARVVHADGKPSPPRDSIGDKQRKLSSSMSYFTLSDGSQRRKYKDRMVHFANNYESSDFNTAHGLGYMLHQAISLKDDDDIFTFLLALKTSAGNDRSRIVTSALIASRSPFNNFLPLQSAVDSRLDEKKVMQLYQRGPAAALDPAMEGLVVGLWAVEQVNQYSTRLIRSLLSEVPKTWLRQLLKRPRSSHGSFVHKYVTHPSSQLSTLNLILSYVSKASRWRDFSNGEIPLHTACRCGGAPTIIDGLVRNDKKSVIVCDKKGWPPLFSLVAQCSGDSGPGTERYTRGEIEMMLSALITAHSPTLTHVTNDGSTILHVMIEHHCDDWLLERTLNECPGIAKNRDRSGKNLLHLICNGTYKRDIDQLLRLHKRAPEEYDNDCKTPLWTLLMNDRLCNQTSTGSLIEWRYHTVVKILQHCPEAAGHTNTLYHERIPLHYVLYNGWMKLARLLISKHPDGNSGLDSEDVMGLIPLHTMLDQKNNFNMVDYGGNKGKITELDMQFLVQTYPDGPSRTTRKGRLPLEYAQQIRTPEYVKWWLLSCHVGNSVAVQTTQRSTLQQGIRLLTQHFPERATNRDANNNLPLHYALVGDCDIDVVKELITLNPSTVHQVNSHGLPPMHLCVSCGGGGVHKTTNVNVNRNRNTLQHLKLIHATSPSAHEVIVYDKTLLHYACEFYQSMPVINYLLNLNQWATKCRDQLGRSPAHFAYDNNMYEVTKLLLSVYADLDDLLLRMNLELLRKALNSRGCVFTVDAVGGNILHRLATNPKSAHVLRAISWYQPWLCRQKNNNGHYPIDVAKQVKLKSTILPLEQAGRLRLPPSEGGEYYGGQDSGGNQQQRSDSVNTIGERQEVRYGSPSSLKVSDICTDSDGFSSDNENILLISEMDPDHAIRTILEKIWVTMGPKYFGIVEKVQACRERKQLTTYHLICDTLGRMRMSLPTFNNVPLLPVLIPIRWMSEGYGSTENVQEVRASTTAVLRKAIGYKDQALENITDFSHFRLYFICETSFLSLKQNVNDDEEKHDDKKTNKKTSNIQDIGSKILSHGCVKKFQPETVCCHQGQSYKPMGGYEVKMPKYKSIEKIRPLVLLSLCILRAGLAAREEHDKLDAYIANMKTKNNNKIKEKKKNKKNRKNKKKGNTIKMLLRRNQNPDVVTAFNNSDDDSSSDDDRGDDNDNAIPRSSTHGWGQCVPSLFDELEDPLTSNSLSLSYLIDVFASKYQNMDTSEQIHVYHPKELKHCMVEMEKIVQKYVILHPQKKKNIETLKHVVHQPSGRHAFACRGHRRRMANELKLQEQQQMSGILTIEDVEEVHIEAVSGTSKSKRNKKPSKYKVDQFAALTQNAEDKDDDVVVLEDGASFSDYMTQQKRSRSMTTTRLKLKRRLKLREKVKGCTMQ